MAFGNTNKLGSGTYYTLLVNSDGQLEIELATQTGHPSTVLVADGCIHTAASVLYGLCVAGISCTDGDMVLVTDGEGGANKIVVAMEANSNTYSPCLGAPITFSTNIYADISIADVTTTLVYVTGVYEAS